MCSRRSAGSFHPDTGERENPYPRLQKCRRPGRAVFSFCDPDAPGKCTAARLHEGTVMLLLILLLALAPHRIVSVAPAITEILFALGAGDQIVGVTTYCNYPEAAKAKPKIGGFTTPNLEAILALRPDQVFMMKNRPDVAQKLRQTGIEVVELEEENLAGIYASIQVIAEKIGVPGKGRSLMQSIERQLREIATTPAAGPRPRGL